MSDTSRTCGGCTLCCSLVAVKEINKPRRTWCEHCTKGVGCQIQETKPQACAEFDCLWLMGGFASEKLQMKGKKPKDFGKYGPAFEDNQRPDKLKAIFYFHTAPSGKGIGVFVSESVPGALLKKDVRQAITIFAANGMEVVEYYFDGHLVYHAEGATYELSRQAVDKMENGETTFEDLLRESIQRYLEFAQAQKAAQEAAGG